MQNHRELFRTIDAIDSAELESWMLKKYAKIFDAVNSDEPKRILSGFIEFEILDELRIKCEIQRPYKVIDTTKFVALQKTINEKKSLFEVICNEPILNELKNKVTMV